MSCSPVRAVEGRDGLCYPVWQPTTKKGKARLRVNKKSICMRQMERLLQVGGQSWSLVVMDGKVTGGGDLSIVWIFKRKPSSVGMVTLLSSRVIPSLIQSAYSEHLLPEVMATREMVLGKGSYRDAELFRNLGVWRDSRAWSRDHLGTFFGIGGKDKIGALRAVRSLCPQSWYQKPPWRV